MALASALLPLLPLLCATAAATAPANPLAQLIPCNPALRTQAFATAHGSVSAVGSGAGLCLACADTSRTPSLSGVCNHDCVVNSSSDCGTTYDGIPRVCRDVPGAGPSCIPCNGAIDCASGAAVQVAACSNAPRTAASAGGAGQVFDAVPSGPGRGAVQLRSRLTPSLCVSADSGSSVVMLPCTKEYSRAQRWVINGTALSPAIHPGLCLDWGSVAPEGPDPECITVRGAKVCGGCAGPTTSSFGFCNASLDTDARIADLVGRLTVEEKAALMSSGPHAVNGVPRLGIPPVPSGEGLHGMVVDCSAEGNASVCATSFPHLTAVGATFNRSLFGMLGQVVGTEARGMKAHTNVWAPDINLFRDPRWGRGQEVAGEDPTLTGAFARSFVLGMQQGPDSRYLQVISSPKHAWGYDLEDNEPIGRLAFDGNISDQDAVEYYVRARLCWP